MDDIDIIELYWARAEGAIRETAAKYGKYCHSIAWNILHSPQDAEECVNDTYLKAWGSMPPQRPPGLAAFLGKITRNLCLNKYERATAQKRGGGQAPLALDELQECIPAANRTEQAMEDAIEEAALVELLNRFLTGLSPEARLVFLRRYWYLSPIQQIAVDYGFSQSKVKMLLLRSRQQLRQALERERVIL